LRDQDGIVYNILTMNTISRIIGTLAIGIAVVALCPNTYAEQVLVELPIGAESSNKLVLQDGEIASLIACNNGYGQLMVSFPSLGKTITWMNTPQGGFSQPYQMVGPCEIFVRPSNPTATSSVTAIFNKTATPSTLTSNTVTLPAINGLGWTVELQQSTDLLNWSTVAPGSTTGTSTLQFYRVKVTQNN
jgi:hypothetical protein